MLDLHGPPRPPSPRIFPQLDYPGCAMKEPSAEHITGADARRIGYPTQGNLIAKSYRKNRTVQVCPCLAVLAVLLLNSGCRSPGSLVTPSSFDPKNPVEVSRLFNQNCAKCHGEDGRAGTFHGWIIHARKFTDAKWQDGATDRELSDAIISGPKAMPAFGKKLSPTEITALVTYVRAFKPQ